MRQAVVRIEGLTESALDAAAEFHAHHLQRARDALRGSEAVALIFPEALYDHRGWRLAVVRDLAREAAPKRVNGVVGNDERAVAQTVAWLEQAPGVTGQLLAVDGKSAAKG